MNDILSSTDPKTHAVLSNRFLYRLLLLLQQLQGLIPVRNLQNALKVMEADSVGVCNGFFPSFFSSSCASIVLLLLGCLLWALIIKLGVVYLWCATVSGCFCRLEFFCRRFLKMVKYGLKKKSAASVAKRNFLYFFLFNLLLNLCLNLLQDQRFLWFTLWLELCSLIYITAAPDTISPVDIKPACRPPVSIFETLPFSTVKLDPCGGNVRREVHL